jgi:hypothetical protein
MLEFCGSGGKRDLPWSAVEGHVCPDLGGPVFESLGFELGRVREPGGCAGVDVGSSLHDELEIGAVSFLSGSHLRAIAGGGLTVLYPMGVPSVMPTFSLPVGEIPVSFSDSGGSSSSRTTYRQDHLRAAGWCP